MKAGLNMIKEAYPLLNVDAVMSVITGSIYLMERPKNSQKSDVVLNALPITNEQLQRGVFNVNIHAPNLKNIIIDGLPDETQPDIETLYAASNVVTPLLDNVFIGDHKMWIANPPFPIKDTDGTWYLNIRVNYQCFQTDFII